MGLGDRQQDGVVLRLRAPLQNPQGPAGIERGLGHQFQERRLAYVMRTGTSRPALRRV